MCSTVTSWDFKKEPIISLSTAEDKYVAGTGVACQEIWMRRILNELRYKQEEIINTYCDKNFAISLSKSIVFHRKSKNIDTRYHLLRELTNDGDII